MISSTINLKKIVNMCNKAGIGVEELAYLFLYGLSLDEESLRILKAQANDFAKPIQST